MKKLIIVGIAMSMWLSADYYSLQDTSVTNQNILIYEGGIELRSGTLVSKYDLNWLKSDKAVKVTAKEPEGLKSYTFDDLMKKEVEDKNFWLVTNTSFYLAETEIKSSSIQTKISDTKSSVKTYEYEIKKAYDKTGKEKKSKVEKVLTKYIDENGGLVAMNLLDHGMKKIVKVEGKQLKQFFKEQETHPIDVKKFDFANEKVYLSYVSKSKGSQKRLQATYEMSKKNIKTVLESPLSLFDPENRSSQIEQNIGILFNYKNKDLFEIKKVQLIDSSADLSWLNHPQKKVVIVDYVNDGVKDKKVLSKSAGQQFYSIEGLFYLVAWMEENSINKKVFTYMNGSLPFDATMKRTGNRHYEMQKSGNTIFSFDVNSKGFVSQMNYPSYDMTLHLESVENDTTRKNKRFLEDFRHKNHIKLVQE